MLNDNIRNKRKQKGLSQEELALKINVVRQTLSKWENGLSVPDCCMLLSLANELDTTVSNLLGETTEETKSDDLKTISEKLEVINLQLANMQIAKTRKIRIALIAICLIIIALFIALFFWNSPYLNWDYNNPQLAVAGTILHGFEFVFVRIAPLIFIGALIALVLNCRVK